MSRIVAPLAEYIWKLKRSTKKLSNSDSLGTELANNHNQNENEEPLRAALKQ